MAKDIIEESNKCRVPESVLHATMLGLAETLCHMPVCRDHVSWNVEELNDIQCRAIYEHFAAGRVNYYGIAEELGALYVEPLVGLSEWWCEQLDDQSPSTISPEQAKLRTKAKSDKQSNPHFPDDFPHFGTRFAPDL